MVIRKSKNQEEIKFRAYWNSALDYQRANNFPLWPEYPDKMIKESKQNSVKSFYPLNP